MKKKLKIEEQKLNDKSERNITYSSLLTVDEYRNPLCGSQRRVLFRTPTGGVFENTSAYLKRKWKFIEMH